ncbi:MAG: molybdenum cofactor guanylyltransferase, partial [Candidatus Hydrothermarchaeaceae archaeon]
SALIVSGGRGLRMGQDKKFLKIYGKSFIERAVDVAREFSDEIIVSVGSQKQMEHTLAQGIKDIKIVSDLKENLGPVMGLLTGMYAANGEWVVSLPVDAPMMKPEIFKSMLSGREGFDAVVPVKGELLEPMHGVYKRDVMIKACEWALEVEGNRSSLQNIVKGLAKVNYIPVEDFKEYDRELLTFHNVNTPVDFKWLMKQADGRK